MPGLVIESTTITGVQTSIFGVTLVVRTISGGTVTGDTITFSADDYSMTELFELASFYEALIGRELQDGEDVSDSFDATFTGDASEGNSYFDGMQPGPNGMEEPTLAEMYGVYQFDIHNGRGTGPASTPWSLSGGDSFSFSNLSAGSDFFF
jgi:hypothetical protein